MGRLHDTGESASLSPDKKPGRRASLFESRAVVELNLISAVDPALATGLYSGSSQN